MIARQFKYSTNSQPLQAALCLFSLDLQSIFKSVGLPFSGVKELFGDEMEKEDQV
jgi:hypothetical protein